MHELIHYWLHDRDMFYCLNGAESHGEWQANEGAAQFLIPYQSFIPNYCYLHDRFYGYFAPQAAHDMLIKALAGKYMVGEMTVKFRIKSLGAEISQYVGGVAVRDIKVVSGNRQYE